MPLLANLRLSNWRRTQFENSCDRKLRVEVYRRGPISTFITQAVIRIARRHTRLRMVVNVRFALQIKGLQIVSRELVVLSWITSKSSNNSSSSSSRCTLKLSPLITQWKLLRKLSLSLICSLYLQMISLSSSKNCKRAIMNWIQLNHLWYTTLTQSLIYRFTREITTQTTMYRITTWISWDLYKIIRWSHNLMSNKPSWSRTKIILDLKWMTKEGLRQRCLVIEIAIRVNLPSQWIVSSSSLIKTTIHQRKILT